MQNYLKLTLSVGALEFVSQKSRTKSQVRTLKLYSEAVPNSTLVIPIVATEIL